MPRKQKKGATRLDKYYHLAKEHGFRARSAFKLVQLNKKYNFLADAHCVIDLCAAPGGWLQVCAKYMPVGSKIIGVDLVAIKPIRNVVTFKEDILTQKCRSVLKKEIGTHKVDVVLHDGSPNMGTSWVNDAYGQSELTLASLKLAVEFLKPGGMFVTKVFRSQDYTALLWVLNQLFQKVEATKPPASRNTSAEIYAVCSGYLAPSKIDPRLLDPHYVFNTTETNPEASSSSSAAAAKGANVFQQPDKATRQRSGYEDGAGSLLYRSCRLRDFVAAPTSRALEMLGAFHTLTLTDAASRPYVQHPSTTDDIKALCADLKVLNKADYKNLLRWRLKMSSFHKELEAQQQGQGGGGGDDAEMGDGSDDDSDDDDQDAERRRIAEQRALRDQAKADSELNELERSLAQRERRAKKKEAERKAKLRHRIASGGLDMDAHDDQMSQSGLFQLNKIKDSASLDAIEVDNDYLPDDEELERSSGDEDDDEDDDEDGDRKGDDVYYTDSDEEARYREMEDDLEEIYSHFKERQNILTKADRKKQAGNLGLEDEQPEEEEDGDDSAAIATMKAAAPAKKPTAAGKNPLIVECKNPLIVELPEGTSESEQLKAKRWFSKDVFAGIEDQLIHDEFSSGGVIAKKKSTAAAAAGSDGARIVSIASLAAEKKKAAAAQDRQQQLAAIKAKQRSGKQTADDEADDEDNADEDGDVAMMSDDEQSGSDGEKEAPPSKKSRVGKSAANSKSKATKQKQEESLEDAALPNPKKDKRRKRAHKKTKGHRKGDDEENGATGGQTFEEVPLAEEYSSDSDAAAEALAIGAQFLRKRSRDDVLDAAYNRYAFNDEDELPSWFVEDEKMHNVPQMPVTKAEVDYFKEQLKAINARPMKKLAEARARKREKTAKAWETMKNKAQAIVDNPDMDASQKLKSVQKLYAGKKGLKEKKDKHYVVMTRDGRSFQAGPRKANTRVKLVDARMKKEIRAQKRKGGKKGGKKGSKKR